MIDWLNFQAMATQAATPMVTYGRLVSVSASARCMWPPKSSTAVNADATSAPANVST